MRCQTGILAGVPGPGAVHPKRASDHGLNKRVLNQIRNTELLAVGEKGVNVDRIIQLLQDGGLTVYPLGLCSLVAVGIFIDRLFRFRGQMTESRSLTQNVVNALAAGDTATMQKLCQGTRSPLGKIFQDGLRWKNIALDDLERILATSRLEAVAQLKTGVWIIGTVGSLAPFIGLFGTVIGIIKAFGQMAIHGSGGFSVVAAGISEALVATAAGLGVAILALMAYNYLQVRIGAISGSYARSCERLVQVVLYVESGGKGPQAGTPSESGQ
jgi:biopolymer transport protein ExbB